MNTTKQCFGWAIVQLKDGKRVARKGWNGKGMWIALQEGSTIPHDKARGGASKMLAEQSDADIVINSHIDMRTADGSICVGWLASQADMLAEDWAVA